MVDIHELSELKNEKSHYSEHLSTIKRGIYEFLSQKTKLKELTTCLNNCIIT